MRIVRTHRSSFERQIFEGIRIQKESKEHEILNSKMEYNRCALPRLVVKVGEGCGKGKDKQKREEERKEAEIEQKIVELKKQNENIRKEQRNKKEKENNGRKEPGKVVERTGNNERGI